MRLCNYYQSRFGAVWSGLIRLQKGITLKRRIRGLIWWLIWLFLTGRLWNYLCTTDLKKCPRSFMRSYWPSYRSFNRNEVFPEAPGCRIFLADFWHTQRVSSDKCTVCQNIMSKAKCIPKIGLQRPLLLVHSPVGIISKSLFHRWAACLFFPIDHEERVSGINGVTH